MVLPLIVGAAALLGFGVIGFSLADFVLYWGSIAAGFSIAVLSFKYLFEEDPVPLTGRDDLNNFLYLGFSILTGYLGFYVVQAAVLAFGFTLALLVAVLLVAGWFLGFGVLASALSSLVLFVVEVFNEVDSP